MAEEYDTADRSTTLPIDGRLLDSHEVVTEFLRTAALSLLSRVSMMTVSTSSSPTLRDATDRS